MRTKRFINGQKEPLSHGQILAKENADIKFTYRVSMVNLIPNEMSVKELAAHCRDGETVLMSWVSMIDHFGWDSFCAKKQLSEPSKLSEDQISLVKDAVIGNSDGHSFKVWDDRFSSKHTKHILDINLDVRVC